MKFIGNTKLTIWLFVACLFVVSLHDNYLQGKLTHKGEAQAVQSPKPKAQNANDYNFRNEKPDALIGSN